MAWDGVGESGVNVAHHGVSGPRGLLAGVAMAALVTGTGTANSGPYGWVAFRGAINGPLVAASGASSAAARWYSINTTGQFAIAASTVATANRSFEDRWPLRSTGATFNTGVPLNTGPVIDLFLR